MSSDQLNDKNVLSRSVEKVPWRVLQPEAIKDYYILVSAEIDLVDAAVEVVSDNAETVKSWIDEKKLSKPSPLQLSDWSKFPDKTFRTLIAHPYVLIQESYDH